MHMLTCNLHTCNERPSVSFSSYFVWQKWEVAYHHGVLYISIFYIELLANHFISEYSSGPCREKKSRLDVYMATLEERVFARSCYKL